MKFKLLLATASAFALSTMSAQALVLGTPTGDSGDVLAAELDLATTPTTGTFGFTITRTGGADFPEGAHIVRIDLPGGRVFAGDNTMNTIEGETGSIGNVTAGGGDGDSFIEYQISFASGGEADFEVAGLMVRATSDVGNNEMVVSVTDFADGSEVDVNPLEDATVFPPSSGSIDTIFEVVADMAQTLISLNTGAPNAGTVFNNLTGGGLIGTVETESGIPVVPGQLGYDDAPGGAVFTNAGNIDDVEIVANFPGGTGGIAGATLGGVAGVIAANTITFTLPGVGGGPLALVLTPEDDSTEAPIVAQVPSSSTGTVNLTGAGLVASVPISTGTGNANFETLLRDGQNGGQHDWNGEGSNGTISLYRVTGLPASSTVTYTVDFTNTVTGQNGIFAGSGMTNAAGELILTSANAFGTSNAGYTRGDVEFNFEVAGIIDVDRLLLRNDILSGFGNLFNGDN